ncbi:MAG: hypothetical protein WA914_05810 [Candidatus Macondimonas sp.]
MAEASRQFDLTPSEIEAWIDNAKAGMENALKAKPEYIREQIKDLQEAYGEAMLEMRARKNSCRARTSRDRDDRSGTA